MLVCSAYPCGWIERTDNRTRYSSRWRSGSAAVFYHACSHLSTIVKVKSVVFCFASYNDIGNDYSAVPFRLTSYFIY